MTKRRISKKKKKDLRASVKGDAYYEKYAEELISLSNNIGRIKTLAAEELEWAKMSLDMSHNVTKEMIKRERKKSQRKRTTKQKSLDGLKKYINKRLNILLESRYTIHFDGNILHVIDIQKGIELEHTFVLVSSRPYHQPGSFMSKWIDIFEKEQRFKNDINLQKGEVRTGEWVEPDFSDKDNAWGRADYNMMEGGYVDVPEATYKKFDMIPAMLCRNEFVFTQEAVRGAGGKYGHMEGAKFLCCLMDFYEQEAKKYPHTKSKEEVNNDGLGQT